MRIALVFGVLAGLAWLVDPYAVAVRLGRVEPGPVLLAVLLVQCQIIASAERWRLTAAALGQTLTRRQAVAEYYVASLLNQLLPGGVSGDVVRAWRNRSDQDDSRGWAVPVQAIMIERLAGQVVLGLIGLLGLLAWLCVDGSRIHGAGVLLAGTAAVFAGLALGMTLLARWAPTRLAAFAASFGPALRAAWFCSGRWAGQSLLSLLIVASYLIAFALASQAVGAPLPPIAVAALVPLVLLSMLLPISVAGWGMREAAAAALWPLAGASAADGIAASVLYGLVSLIGALPGAPWIARGRGHAQPARRA